LGLSVVLIEKGKLGGTCLHRGCIPTKALLHAGEVADSARESEAFGVDATLNGIDMNKVNAYRDGIVGRLYKGLQGLVKSRNGGVNQHGVRVFEFDSASFWKLD
jgi:dihydrolipoamide dehydrogenase